jgi:hypothetical protein
MLSRRHGLCLPNEGAWRKKQFQKSSAYFTFGETDRLSGTVPTLENLAVLAETK